MTSAPSQLNPTHVDIRAIERELTNLWQSAAESADSGRTSPVTRTCMANLVVVVDERGVAGRATQVIDRLTGVYPNRAIVTAALAHEGGTQPEHAATIDAWVQAHCQLPAPGRPQVCGEQITVEAHGEAAGRIPGVVLPLLVPDVPVALWLPHGEPARHPVAAKLTDIADRLIVNSATFATPEASLPTLAGLIDADTGVSDLAWARLTGWRELVAQFFDAPAMLPHLSEVERIRLTVPSQPGQPSDRSQALMLVGWLASRLGWKVAEHVGGARLVRADGAEVALEIATADQPDDQPDRLMEVVIGCRRATFTVSRYPGADVAVTRAEVDGMRPIQRTARLEWLDEASLLAGELQLLGRDRTFESALRVAATLVATV
ncbi:MAG: hypothetical protein RLZZ387_1790 [Chloroflexota bacterium]